MKDLSWKNIFFADDDSDDVLFFSEAAAICLPMVKITHDHDGEKLMERLRSTNENLPDLVFLDLNMPRMAGTDCLHEIRNTPKLKNLIVVIYSTGDTYSEIDKLYRLDANYYVVKPTELKKLCSIFADLSEAITQNGTIQPARNKFVLKG